MSPETTEEPMTTQTKLFILQAQTPRYIYVMIQMPLYILVTITYYVSQANIYFKISETTSTTIPTPQFDRITTNYSSPTK